MKTRVLIIVLLLLVSGPVYGQQRVRMTNSESATVTMQNAAVASGNGTVITVDGQAGTVLTVNCSGCSGGTTVNFEGQNDGTNFFSLFAIQQGNGAIALNTTTAGVTGWYIPASGLKQVRARISAYSAGTITVTGTTVPMGSSLPFMQAYQATGSNFHVTCDAGCSGSVAPTDNAAFSAGVSPVTPISAFYHSTRDSATNGTAGAIAMNVNRAMITQIEDVSKNAVTTTSDGGSKRGIDANLINLATDAAEGAVPTSAPIPLGCRRRDTNPAIGDTFMIYVRCNTNGELMIPTNQTVNVAQINGVTPLMGAGNTGTGSPRVTIATDQAALAGLGVGATGTAVPASAQYNAGQGSSGNTTGFIRCDGSAVYDTNTNGKTTLVALSSGKVVYVCGISLVQSTTSTVTVSLGSGTGTNCVTTYTAKTPAWVLAGQAAAAMTGQVLPLAQAPWFQTAASEHLCISTNAAVSVQLLVSYAQF